MSIQLELSPEPNWPFLYERFEEEKPVVAQEKAPEPQRPAGVSYAREPQDSAYLRLKLQQIGQLFANRTVNRPPAEFPDWYFKA